MKHRDDANAPVGVVRVEQLYPWPGDQLAEVVARYERASELVWLQEEPENMGPWPFVSRRVQRLLGPTSRCRWSAAPSRPAPPRAASRCTSRSSRLSSWTPSTVCSRPRGLGPRPTAGCEMRDRSEIAKEAALPFSCRYDNCENTPTVPDPPRTATMVA